MLKTHLPGRSKGEVERELMCWFCAYGSHNQGTGAYPPRVRCK
jgi:hypothetical protein